MIIGNSDWVNTAEFADFFYFDGNEGHFTLLSGCVAVKMAIMKMPARAERQADNQERSEAMCRVDSSRRTHFLNRNK